MPLETAIQAEILRALQALGCLVVRMNSRVLRVPGAGGRDRLMRVGGVKGMADIVGCDPRQGGRFLAVEVKRPGGVPTPEQAGFLAAVKRAGGLAFVAWSAHHAVDLLQRAREEG